MERILKVSLAIVIILIAVNLFMRLFPVRMETSPALPPDGTSTKSADISDRSIPEGEMPSNAIPSVEVIEENINKAEKRRKDIETARDEFKEKKKEMLSAEVDPTEQAADIEETGAVGVQYLPGRKKEVFPTREERDRMQSQGIICY